MRDSFRMTENQRRTGKLPEIHVLSTRKKVKQGAHSAQYLVSVDTQVIYTGNTLSKSVLSAACLQLSLRRWVSN